MEMETENHHHHQCLQPLISPTATSPQSPTTQPTAVSNNSDIILRLLTVIFIGLVSIWANHESSRFFDITVVNDFRHTPAGKLFNLRYVSNDKASDMILEATVYVGHRLYNETRVTILMKELISHVTLRTVNGINSKNSVTVDFTKIDGYRRFTVNVSLSIFEKEPEKEMVYALRRAMARVWLWDSITELTSDLVEGIVDYVAVDVVGDVAENYTYAIDVKNPRAVAEVLSRCEKRTEGFVRRLVDRISKDRWREGEALLHMCMDLMNGSMM